MRDLASILADVRKTLSKGIEGLFIANLAPLGQVLFDGWNFTGNEPHR